MIITVYMMDEVKNDYHCIHDGWSKVYIITVYMMDGWSKEWLSLYTWWMK